MLKRIGVLTGGGDCPGLNPAIKWVTKTALDEALFHQRGYRFEVYGIHEGYRGLVNYSPSTPILEWGVTGGNEAVTKLTERAVRRWDRFGGTNLGSSRTNPYKSGQDTSQLALYNIKELGLDALVCIGGEDTMLVAHRLHQEGVNVVGIPKTIDLDLIGTEYSLGFDTALNVIREEVDRVRTTAKSHGRTFIIETMGRHAGHLALKGGIAAGADIILIPEHPFEVDRVAELLEARYADGSRYAIVIVSEGAYPKGGDVVTKDYIFDSGFSHVALGGVGEWLEHKLAERLDKEIRSVVLSHLQRGGMPSAYERRIGRLFGIAAVSLIEQKQFGRMVCLQDNKINHVPIPGQKNEYSLVNVDKEYDTDRYTMTNDVLGHWDHLD